jgi:putative ABC transport system permease protein
MKAILRQAKANARSHKLQATLVFSTLFASAILLTIALNTMNITNRAFDRLFERTHAPHLWLLLDPLALPTDEVEQKLSELPGVLEIGRAYRTIPTTLFLGELRESGPSMRNWPEDSDSVNRPLLVEGRAPHSGETDTIVLDRNAALEYKVQVGDRVGVLTPSGRVDLKVVGLFVSTEVCPTCFPFIYYVAPGTMKELGVLTSWEDEAGALEIGLRLSDPSKTQETLEAAQEIFPDDMIWGWDKWQGLRSASDSSIELQRILLLTFTVVALLASGLLIANTIRGTTRAQTRQMGLLKAVGFTNGQLILVYLLEHVGLALIASLAGLIVGSIIAMFILRSFTLLFGDSLARIELWILLATPSVTVFVTSAFSILSVVRAVRLNVVEAIRFGEERPRYRRGRLGTAVFKRLPVPLAVGLRDVLAQPARAGLTTIGLGIAVIAMVSGLTLKATIQTILEDLTQLGFNGDLSIWRSDFISEGEILELITSQPEIASFYSERWRSFQIPGEERYYFARFREGDLDAFRFPIVEGRMFEKHGEVVAGYGLVKDRGLQIGDKVDITIDEVLFSVSVVGFYRESSNNGMMMILPAETLRRALPGIEPYTFVVKLHPDSNPQAVTDTLVKESNDFLGVRIIGEQELPVNIASLPKIMLALTLVLGGIAAVGVFNSVWMNVQERRRGFGVLKSIGMTSEEVIYAVLVGVVGLTLIAYIVGLPLGLAGIDALINMVSSSIGFGPLDLSTDEIGLVVLLPGIVILALLGAFIPAYRAGRTNVVDVLRFE